MNITTFFKTGFVRGHSICRGPLFLGHPVLIHLFMLNTRNLILNGKAVLPPYPVYYLTLVLYTSELRVSKNAGTGWLKIYNYWVTCDTQMTPRCPLTPNSWTPLLSPHLMIIVSKYHENPARHIREEAFSNCGQIHRQIHASICHRLLHYVHELRIRRLWVFSCIEAIKISFSFVLWGFLSRFWHQLQGIPPLPWGIFTPFNPGTAPAYGTLNAQYMKLVVLYCYYAQRNSHNIEVALANRQFHITAAAPMLWNNLPLTLKNACHLCYSYQESSQIYLLLGTL